MPRRPLLVFFNPLLHTHPDRPFSLAVFPKGLSDLQAPRCYHLQPVSLICHTVVSFELSGAQVYTFPPNSYRRPKSLVLVRLSWRLSPPGLVHLPHRDSCAPSSILPLNWMSTGTPLPITRKRPSNQCENSTSEIIIGLHESSHASKMLENRCGRH